LGSIFLLIILGFFSIYIWFSISSEQYLEEASPYLDTNLPIVLNWDFEQLKPLLTTGAAEAFESERGQKVHRMFSKLGKLESIEEPQFVSASSGVSIGAGVYDVVTFSVLAHFETGQAQVSVTLVPDSDSYKIHYLQINSDAFLE
jgi:hypothetical protein